MSTTLPDFKQIIFLPNETKAVGLDLGGKTDLWKLFLAIVNHEDLVVDQEQLKQIMSENLNVDVNHMDRRLLGVLKEALVYYIKIWPGWERTGEYYKGELLLLEWFGRFRNYLIFKTNVLVVTAAKYANKKKQDVGIQSNVLQKDIAPYTLCISGPPCILNNIVFEESDGNILIKQQKIKPWCNLKLKEFLNWPYVSVVLKLPDISFTRTNTHKFERYMATRDDFVVFPETNHIKHIKKTGIVVANNFVPYTSEFIASYLKCLYETVKNISGMNVNRLQELKAIFIEFLQDIKEANVYNCTVCTNTSVGYNIGKHKYVRKSRVPKDALIKNVIDYYEILTPQVDYTLDYVGAVQDINSKDGVAFKIISKGSAEVGLRDTENLRYIINNACIEYHCTLCSEGFLGRNGQDPYFNLTKHFADKHRGQPSVKCCKCCKDFEVKDLAGQRWTHACV